MTSRVLACLLASAVAAVPTVVRADTALLENPNWNITLTDAGYSDLLLDNTPGFVGREYLSGEWAAAVSYQRLGQSYSPTWLERNFVYPDWQTNSNFSVVTPITSTGNAASSVIASSHLRVAIDYQMIDTVTGMKMGIVKASAGGAGGVVDSNRYVLQQSYTITNISGEDITNLNLFQMLHSLEGSTTLYDNRLYNSAAGGPSPLGAFRYDTTQIGVSSPPTTGDPITLLDYIGFAGSVAPVAIDSGWYGSDDPLSPYYTDHAVGKPPVGVHINIENNALTGADYFTPPAPATMYVAGAQKYSLGVLGDGNSVSFSVVLSIKTGTVAVPAEDGSSGGSANGGAGNVGGVDYHFTHISSPSGGTFFAEYAVPDADELAERIAEGEFESPLFYIPGAMQLFSLEFDGEYTGDITLTLHYDESLLPVGFDENALIVYHFADGKWKALESSVDALNHTVTVITDSLSPFAIGAVPEPSTLAVLALAAMTLLAKRRR